MAIGDDYSIAVNGDIRYTGAAHGAAGAGYYTVFAFQDWVRDLSDDEEAVVDDIMDITVDTATNRQTDNIVELFAPFNIDQTASEHLYDGSIIQNGGDDIWDGIVVIANEGMDLQIIQNGAIITNDFWNTIPNGETEKGLNRDVGGGISHRFMLQVRSGGSDIDGRRIVGITRQTGFTYSEFALNNGTSRANNVLALNYVADNNDSTDASTRTTITNLTEGYALLDISGDAVNEPYYSEWDLDIYTINQGYERWKYITRTGETALIYGLPGELFRGITHQVNLNTAGTNSGTFSAFEPVSWPGGTGQMLAIEDTTASAADTMWIQLLTGNAPGNGVLITGGTSSATATTAAATASETRVISTPFCGQSTGSSLIGAYGFGLQTTDTSAADSFIDLGLVPVTPPNNVQFTVSGLTVGEDRVLVGPESGGVLDVGQFLVQGALTGGETSVTVDAGTETPGTGTDSATDTPTSGTIRIQGTNGVRAYVTYTGYTVGAGTMTFTGCSGVPAAADNAQCYISYLDKLAASTGESFTVVFSANRGLIVRVRDGGTAGDTEAIKPFESPASLTSSGGGATAIRTADV